MIREPVDEPGCTPCGTVTRLLVLADDLSGALDAAACFCGDFGTVVTHVEVPTVLVDPAVALDLETRERPDAAVPAAMASVRRFVSGAAVVFKKVDSMLRGPWAREIACLLEAHDFRTCVFAPAFPRHGRHTVNGWQCVREDGRRHEVALVDACAALVAAGLEIDNVKSRDVLRQDAAGPRPGVVSVCDASSDEDLEHIVQWAAKRGSRILWCGSAGLARALSKATAPSSDRLRGPVLAIYGTHHSASRSQLKTARRRGIRHRVLGDADAETQARRITLDLQETGRCAVSFDLSGEVAAAVASATIAQRLARLLPRLEKPTSLIVTGGETLRSVCQAMEVQRIELVAEFEPGIPRSILREGPWDGVELASKSGGFGRSGWLVDMMEKTAGTNGPR